MKHTKKELLDTIESLVTQFAFNYMSLGMPAYGTGGLSALENAFDVLGWSDPQPAPEHKCQYGKCNQWANCGTPSKDGYKRVCEKHFSKIQKESD